MIYTRTLKFRTRNMQIYDILLIFSYAEFNFQKILILQNRRFFNTSHSAKNNLNFPDKP